MAIPSGTAHRRAVLGLRWLVLVGTGVALVAVEGWDRVRAPLGQCPQWVVAANVSLCAFVGGLMLASRRVNRGSMGPVRATLALAALVSLCVTAMTFDPWRPEDVGTTALVLSLGLGFALGVAAARVARAR